MVEQVQMNYKHFNHEEKEKIVLEGLKLRISIKELCEKYTLDPEQYYIWEKCFLDAGRKALIELDSRDH